jgi:hypothetical protein
MHFPPVWAVFLSSPNVFVACIQDALLLEPAVRARTKALEEATATSLTPITFEAVPCCNGACGDKPCVWSFVERLVQKSVANASVVALERVSALHLKKRYENHRTHEVMPTAVDHAAHELLLFHGTGASEPHHVLLSGNGLSPLASKGGFYGDGTYLAKKACYPMSGRYGYRVPGSTDRVRLVLVRVCTGTPWHAKGLVNARTRSLKEPPVRIESSPPVRFNCVRAGPHRPHAVGTGEGASEMYVVYEKQQMLAEYIVELRVVPPPRVALKRKALSL